MAVMVVEVNIGILDATKVMESRKESTKVSPFMVLMMMDGQIPFGMKIQEMLCQPTQTLAQGKLLKQPTPVQMEEF